MNRRPARQIEDMLRSGAPSARREPSSALRARVTVALESHTPNAERTSMRLPERASIAGPVGRAAWRERSQGAFVAASVLIAVGLWVSAFIGVLQGGVHPSAPAEAAARNSIQATWRKSISAIQDPASPGTFAQLARATPQTLRTAVDDSLFAELENIAQDATRAARFLVSRLPASLVTRGTEEPPH